MYEGRIVLNDVVFCPCLVDHGFVDLSHSTLDYAVQCCDEGVLTEANVHSKILPIGQ